MTETATTLASKVKSCRICAERFAATHTQHQPRPVAWFQSGVRILIAGQAPGIKVHEAGKPFFDRSGDRLRDWMGIDAETFYDRDRIAIVPMAFCFPGYNASGSDLPPPKICAETWRAPVLATLKNVQLTLLIGGYAQKWHLGTRDAVTETVRNWSIFQPETIPLPHPSWRNTSWLKKNPWFESDLLPVLRTRVAEALT